MSYMISPYTLTDFLKKCRHKCFQVWYCLCFVRTPCKKNACNGMDKVMIMLVLDLERFSVSGEQPYTG